MLADTGQRPLVCGENYEWPYLFLQRRQRMDKKKIMLAYYILHPLLRLVVLACGIGSLFVAATGVGDFAEANRYEQLNALFELGVLLTVGATATLYGLGGYPLLRKVGFCRLSWEGGAPKPAMNKLGKLFVPTCVTAFCLHFCFSNVFEHLSENGDLSEFSRSEIGRNCLEVLFCVCVYFNHRQRNKKMSSVAAPPVVEIWNAVRHRGFVMAGSRRCTGKFAACP